MTTPISMNLTISKEPVNAAPSALDNNKLYEWILQTTFTTSARGHIIKYLSPHLSDLVRPGDLVLDLCCGSGLMSFWFEEQGAQVTAVDFAPYMIALACEEAVRRNSLVRFVEADIFAHDLGRDRYDLITCFGNSISDFPLSNFANLAEKISHALKPEGWFLLEYEDGSYSLILNRGDFAGVIQEIPERITYRFEMYLPEIGSRVVTYENETRGVSYQRKAFIYTVPCVQLAASQALALDRHIILTESHYLDAFVKS